MIAENLESVRRRIARSCGKANRPPQDVKLVAVTKEAETSEIEEALRLGVKELGENRVQDALLKYKDIAGRATWHLIGHLQTNKVKDAVKIFSLIHSVDSIRLAKEIDKEAKKMGKVQDILIQVNTSGESTKFGLAPQEILDVFKEICLYPNINIKGLMTIAPEADDPEIVRPYFKALRELRDSVLPACRQADKAPNSILSMGMTNDFEVAIEEGANIVRIGRAIFG